MGWSAWVCELVVHFYCIYTRVVYSIGLGLWLAASSAVRSEEVVLVESEAAYFSVASVWRRMEGA